MAKLINGRYTVTRGTLGNTLDYDYADSNGIANRKAEAWRKAFPDLEVCVYYSLTLLNRWKGERLTYSK